MNMNVCRLVQAGFRVLGCAGTDLTPEKAQPGLHLMNQEYNVIG